MARESVFPFSDESIAAQLRQLALVDRVLGLEAEVARLTVSAPAWASPRSEIERLTGELESVYASTTWKLGTAALKPMRFVLRLRRPHPKR